MDGLPSGWNDRCPTFSVVTRLIAFVVLPDLQILDATGALAAFEIAERHSPGTYALTLVATLRGPVRS